MSDLGNFYNTLGVPQTASAEEIRQAYRQLVQVWHPDRFQGNPEILKRAERETKQLNEAFRHLSDPQRRAQHDDLLDRLRADTVKPHESPPGPSPSQQKEKVVVVTCPNPGCEVGLRVPTKRRLKVACPRCNTHFMYDSTLESTWNVHVSESDEDSGGHQAESHFAAVVNSGLRKPIYWVTSVTALVIGWAISVMAIVLILNSGKLLSQPSLMSTAPHLITLPKERSVVAPLTEVRTRDFQPSPGAPEKGLSVAPTSTALPQASLPNERVSLAPPIQIRTQDPSDSSFITPEANQEKHSLIPRVELQPMSLPTGIRIGLYRVPPGRGSLRIVNGTHLDALVRFGEYAEHRRPLASLYIKAGEELKINDIGEGDYRLAFSLGIDWDQDTKEFRQNKVYTVFDELFEFKEITRITEIETNDGPKTRTSIRFVEAIATLHAVPDGHAKATLIDKKTFDHLFEGHD